MTGPPRDPQTLTRRSVLRTGAAGLGLAAGATSIASAQTDTGTGEGTDEEGEGEQEAIEEGVIIEQQNLEQAVTGFWIQIGGTVDPLEASVSDRCDLVDWGDGETLAYDALLIDRTADPQQQPITLYLHESVDISPGTLFIINNQQECESGYLGVRLERIGLELSEVRAAEPASPTGTVDDEGGGGGGGGGAEGPVGGAGPGFGVGGALAGLAGAGWLLRNRDGD